jgi:MinD-like ATPase involved in chromosome partitioning or flagellar assembly
MDVIKRKNKIVLFYSPQGGTGKSTIAVNTAIILANQGLKILLVDTAIYGSIMSILRIPQKGDAGLSSILTFLDLDIQTTNFDKFNDVLKNSIVKGTEEQNLDVLIGANPIKMEAINEIYAKAITKGLRELNYDLIIVDTSSELSEKNVILLEEADYTVIPVTQDITCGWKLVLFKEITERYLLDQNKFAIIVNKCNKYSGFNNAELEKEVGYKIIMEIPFFTKKFQNYINKGLSVYSMRNKKVQKCFINVAKAIMNIEK